MVPAIFKEMEEADNSDGFDSCEEAKSEKSGEKVEKSNPFQDFNVEILEIKDENEAMSIRIGRKMIVDYIERGADAEYGGWKKMAQGGSKEHPIVSWTPVKTGANVEFKFEIPVPNSTLEDLFRHLQEPDLKAKYDDSHASTKLIRNLPLNNKI